MKNIIVAHTLLIVVLFLGCEQPAFFDAGDISTREFPVDSFHTLEVESIFEIELQNADENKIIATAGENLLEKLSFFVNDKRLYLNNDNKYDWSRKYKKIKLIVQTTSMTQINIRNSCKITTKTPYAGTRLSIIDWEKYSEIDIDVDVNDFRMHVSSDNGGIYRISGNTDFASIRPWGSCFIYADELIAGRIDIYHRSIGDCLVYAQNKLDIKMEEHGILYYKGNPEVDIKSHTAGEIIKME